MSYYNYSLLNNYSWLLEFNRNSLATKETCYIGYYHFLSFQGIPKVLYIPKLYTVGSRSA